MARLSSKLKLIEDQSAWIGFGKFLGLVLLAVLLFLLGQSMVAHHFFTGGALDYGNHPTGP